MTQLKDQPTPSAQKSTQGTSTENDYMTLATELMSQALETGSNFAGLLGAELQLAVSDAIRLIMLSKIFTQLVIYCWLGFSVFASWVVYDFSDYGPWSALTFTVLQVMALLAARLVIRKLKHSLTLPMTRAQLNTFGVTGHDQTHAPSQ